MRLRRQDHRRLPLTATFNFDSPAWFSQRRNAAGFRRDISLAIVIEPRFRDVCPVTLVGAELPQRLRALDVIGDIAPADTMRRIAQPLQNRHRRSLFGRRQFLDPARDGLAVELGGNSPAQRVLRVA
jgi:hypothetical protein